MNKELKNVIDELVYGIEDCYEMNLRNVTRIMLLGQFLVEKGLCTDEELIEYLSDEAVDEMIAEAKGE